MSESFEFRQSIFFDGAERPKEAPATAEKKDC
jgi:hypothetical protein